MISNHFKYKDLVHHPIAFQPFTNGWLLGVPGIYIFFRYSTENYLCPLKNDGLGDDFRFVGVPGG